MEGGFKYVNGDLTGRGRLQGSCGTEGGDLICGVKGTDG